MHWTGGGGGGLEADMRQMDAWSVGAVHKVQTLHVICAESLLCRRGKAVSATVGYSWFPSAVVFSNFDIDIVIDEIENIGDSFPKNL